MHRCRKKEGERKGSVNQSAYFWRWQVKKKSYHLVRKTIYTSYLGQLAPMIFCIQFHLANGRFLVYNYLETKHYYYWC